jgi:putative photosynthetic complex assembly protein 2
MILYGYPTLFALFVWWFSTGAIMYLDGLPRRTFKWSILGATILFGLSLWATFATRNDLSVRAAYAAFTYGLLAWGWQEISFYMGYVTGPRRAPCPEGCSGWAHFGHAIQTSLWHELAIIASAIAIVACAWGGANQIAVWTFMVLWWMHQSAKLNVFLGVRNLNEEFLPEHLQFLRSFLTKKPMNLLFPFSITISTVILVKLVQAAVAPHASRFDRAGFCFLSVLMALAVLEHWLLVLPLPAAKLWGWSLSSRKVQTPFEIEVVSGFLGAGKTTFMRRRLESAGPRTVVLVNDFASVGIDGSLLQGQGADVVELPNGCICCSLRKDLTQQLSTMVAKYAPERVLIEPSGVADLASLMATLNDPALKPMVRSQSVTTVIDAGAFLADHARNRTLLEAQARLASVLVVNKADLATPAELVMVQNTLRELNAIAPIMAATYGVAQTGSIVTRAVAHAHHEGHDHHDHDHHDHEHHHEPHPSMQAWDTVIEGVLRPDRLLPVLEAVAAGSFGDIRRLKGIARAGAGWIRFDVAGGRPSLAAFAPGPDEIARVVAIGDHVDTEALRAQLLGCVQTKLTVAA